MIEISKILRPLTAGAVTFFVLLSAFAQTAMPVRQAEVEVSDATLRTMAGLPTLAKRA